MEFGGEAKLTVNGVEIGGEVEDVKFIPGDVPVVVGPGQFQCECCGGIFNKGRTDEEAAAEARANGYDPAMEDCGLVCDTCFHSNFAHVNKNGAASIEESTLELLRSRRDKEWLFYESPGLPYSSLQLSGAVASNGTPKGWTSKTPEEILADVNVAFGSLERVPSVEEFKALMFPLHPLPREFPVDSPEYIAAQLWYSHLMPPNFRCILPVPMFEGLSCYTARLLRKELYRQRRLKPRKYRGRRME